MFNMSYTLIACRRQQKLKEKKKALKEKKALDRTEDLVEKGILCRITMFHVLNFFFPRII